MTKETNLNHNNLNVSALPYLIGGGEDSEYPGRLGDRLLIIAAAIPKYLSLRLHFFETNLFYLPKFLYLCRQLVIE